MELKKKAPDDVWVLDYLLFSDEILYDMLYDYSTVTGTWQIPKYHWIAVSLLFMSCVT